MRNRASNVGPKTIVCIKMGQSVITQGSSHHIIFIKWLLREVVKTWLYIVLFAQKTQLAMVIFARIQNAQGPLQCSLRQIKRRLSMRLLALDFTIVTVKSNSEMMLNIVEH